MLAIFNVLWTVFRPTHQTFLLALSHVDAVRPLLSIGQGCCCLAKRVSAVTGNVDWL